MKITVIKGSPRKNGGSNILVSEFVKGVKDFGAEIFEFDAHNSNVNFCVACNHCGMGESHCIFKDDFEQLKENLLEYQRLKHFNKSMQKEINNTKKE